MISKSRTLFRTLWTDEIFEYVETTSMLPASIPDLMV
jgi:hypothetical protein